jgi:GTP-binding protein YchF
MKSGLIGLPGAGKTTVFEALTGTTEGTERRGEPQIAAMRVPDPRLDTLSAMYQPRKTTYAQVEYFLPGRGAKEADGNREASPWTPVRDCDALIQVVRNFGVYGLAAPTPLADFRKVEQELVLSDFLVAQKRLERLELDAKRGKKPDPEESALVQACVAQLEKEVPLRRFAELCAAPQLRGFAFLSAKPVLVLFNNEDDDEQPPPVGELADIETCLVLRGKLEQELAHMAAEEAAEFLSEFNIAESARDRIIRQSYELLGLISFFTVGEDEVRAWTIRKGTSALDAADVIHSDIKKGFIRAEVVAYRDLMDAGSYAGARKAGTVRLEGKTYTVQDGDIIHFRFNV